MIINIEDILREPGLSKNFEGSFVPEDIIWQGEPVKFKDPLFISGKITNSGTVLIMEADVRAKAILQCGSCLESYEQNLEFSFEARLVKSSEEDDDPDLFKFEGYDIDLSEIVWEFLLLEIPTKRRCREDCKGLCPDCGTNLNYQTCKCGNNEENDPDLAFDERLKVLKDYFSTEGKEV